MEVKQINIKDITPYENNAKIHPDHQIDQIAKSLEMFGWQQPMVISKDGVIVIGHGRFEAAKKLGQEEVPCVIAEDLTDDELRMLRLADNKLNESPWDMDILAEELEGLDFGDLDLEWGLDDDPEPIEVTEDDYEVELPPEPKSQRGDIYQLGRHRLMCGDSTSVPDVSSLIGGANIDLVLTDPPYGINIVGKNGKVGADNMAKNHIYAPVMSDEDTDTAERAYEVLKDICSRLIIWGGNYFTDFLDFSDGWIIWDKREGMTSNNFADGEMAWCSFHTPVRIYHQLWSGMIRAGGEKKIHPTQKPVRLLGDILKDFSMDDDNILDVFGGSGSTLIACEQLDRTCYMMELEPRYIDLIIDRWETFAGEKAVKLNV